MPKKQKKQKEEIGIVDILKYSKQIQLMKKIIDGIMEPTEEEKKYKEKHKKDMDYPKEFREEENNSKTWEWREREFAKLSEYLGVLLNYSEEKSNIDECKEAWEKFDQATGKENGFLVDIQEKVHEKYAVGDGEFSALTNPRVRRLVQIADIASDLEGLKNAIYERELVKDIQEKAFKVRFNKRNYLKSKKEFADNYVGLKVEQYRTEAQKYLFEVEKLKEKNLKLTNQIKDDEKVISEYEVWKDELSKKLQVQEQKKLEFDTRYRAKSLEVTLIKAYREFNKYSKQILEFEEQIKVFKKEQEVLEETREGYRADRIEALKALMEKNDPVVLKYKGRESEYQLYEEMMVDEELMKKHPKLHQIAGMEFGLMNAASAQNTDRDVAIEKLQDKIRLAEPHLDTYRDIINNNDRPDLAVATDEQLRDAQSAVKAMQDEKDITIKKLSEEIGETKGYLESAINKIEEKKNAIKDAKEWIDYYNGEINNNQINYETMKAVVDKATMAMGNYNKLQDSKKVFIDSMEGFDFGKKTANRLIKKANTYNLDEGTRWMHKNTQEFNKMKEALNEVKKCDPADRGELKNRLKALGIAAKEYREKKLKDGGFNTGMRNTRLTKAQNLITMCELGIQELSAIPEKKEKELTDFKQNMEDSLKRHTKQDKSKKLNDIQIVDAKLNRAHEKKDKFDARLELADKKINELQELIEYDDADFSK